MPAGALRLSGLPPPFEASHASRAERTCGAANPSNRADHVSWNGDGCDGD